MTAAVPKVKMKAFTICLNSPELCLQAVWLFTNADRTTADRVSEHQQ